MRTLALLFFVSAVAFAQCTVDGTVVNSTNGAPIERAHVSITAAGDTLFADSDATGKWNIEHVGCENATLVVNRPGFLRTQQAIAKSAHDIRVKLAPQAVLAGRVVDEQGDPILGAQVSLMTSRVINGVRGVQASTSTGTNDLGEYRFSGLAAGKYMLCANAGGGAVTIGAQPYGGKCYPGSSPMDIAAGYEDRIEFTLSPLATVRVAGQISGLDGGQATVSLLPRTQIARMSLGLSARVRADGGFAIKSVPPSSYTAFVTSDNRQTAISVEVGSADIDSLQLHFDPGSAVTGMVKVVSATGRKPAGGMNVELVATAGVAFGRGAPWNADTPSFTIPDTPSGTYHLDITLPTPFYVKSVTLGGTDISTSEFLVGPGMGNIEIVLADDGGAVEGDVSPPAWVLLQKDGLSSRNARTDANGHFKIDNLPPGDYKVFAWDDNTNVEYGNPEWMRQNARGVTVSVAPGQTAQVRVTRLAAPPN